MKVLHINSLDFFGGAAKAAYRLNMGFIKNNISSRLLVKYKTCNGNSIFQPEISSYFDSFYNKLANRNEAILKYFYKIPQTVPYSFNYYGLKNIASLLTESSEEIINLHWINAGFLALEDLKVLKNKKRIFWTLHDSWPFTGGCHIPYKCNLYEKDCSDCVLLDNVRTASSKKLLNYKKKIYDDLDMTIIAPSKWMHDCAKKSSLFANKDIRIIPNGIDTNVFRKIDRSFSCDLLHLDPDKLFILFGAVSSTDDENKGFDYLFQAISKLSNYVNLDNSKIEIIIFGGNEPKKQLHWNYKVHYLGNVNDEITLSLVYSVADVMVLPSKSENLPNVLLESLACGTPGVAFSLGGITDIIDHKINGYLAKPFDLSDLSAGIGYVLNCKNSGTFLEQNARSKALEFDINNTVNKYFNLYSEYYI